MKRLALALVLALAACNPYLSAQSVAPPGRSARLDEVSGFWGLQRYRLELSRGVAIAVTCNLGGPCEHVRATADDPAIAEVRPASWGVLEPAGFGQQTASAIVIVGKAPGTTRIRVVAEQGHRDITVTVVAPPAVAAERTVAR